MFKTTENVPAGIRYISEWKDFQIKPFPHILDKKIPGCGFTSYCLTNNQDVVLCSPRKILLQNKADQHGTEVFYLMNYYEQIVGMDKDLTKISRASLKVPDEPNEKEKSEYFSDITKRLMNYIDGRRLSGLPCKILVTYDSFHLVKDVLRNALILHKFQIVIDEFQSIFTDSRFKSSTELGFLDQLKNIQQVCYVSATPMIEKYLEKIDEFNQLTYIELDWEALQPGRTIKPKLKVLQSRSVFSSAKEIIEKYKSGQFEKSWKKDRDKIIEIESREAVIYVNSVSNIISIIKNANLQPEEVNILCANTPENVKKLKARLGKKYVIGRVPLKGQPHKMFTLCTRTVYLGADFYSTNARTFVISDANIETLAVDISLDLPQILGRQRLEENPWKNEATFYYKSICDRKVLTQEDFNKFVEWKMKETQSKFNNYNTCAEPDAQIRMYDKLVKMENYRDDYVAVNKTYDPITAETKLIPVLNKLVIISEQRAFEIQQIDYADRFTVFSSVGKISSTNKINDQVQQFLQVYEKLPSLYEKLKYLCEYPVSDQFKKDYILGHITEKHFKDYYLTLGSERLRGLSYNITKINKELGIITFDQEKLKNIILKEFNTGDKLSRDDIKFKLSILYNQIGYKKTPKAVDLEEWFTLKKIQINTRLEDGSYKRDHGFEILAKK